jgi:hypothetical protein
MLSNILNINNSRTEGFLIILIVGIYILYSYILGLVFQKAHQKMWKAFVPIYNNWVYFELGGVPGALSLIALLGLIPSVGFAASLIVLIFYTWASIEIARRFSKSLIFAIFGLVIFSIIGIMILAFGDSKYQYPENKSQ